MTPFDRALRRANELRYQAYEAAAAGRGTEARALHKAANDALYIIDRTKRLRTLLEALASLAPGSSRALRRWSLALWVLGARVKTLRSIRRSVSAVSVSREALS